MGKIKDLMELNNWLGNKPKRIYFAVMQNKRFLPKDREFIKEELGKKRVNLNGTIKK